MKKNLPLNTNYKKTNTEIYQLLNQTKVCFFKNVFCTKVIDAHSITNSSLSKIADSNKQLYVSKIDSIMAQDDLKYKSFFTPKKESISRISTFKGMCGFHDKEIFREIEDNDIIPSDTQVLKFHFRAIAYNYYSKIPIIKVLDNFKNTILPEKHSINQKFHTTLDSAYEHFPKIKKEIYGELENYKDAILNKTKIDFNYLFIRIDSIPEVMCCETITPIHDLDGNFLLSKLRNDFDPVQYLILNISSDAKGGFLLISWNKEFEICNSFVSSLQRINYDFNKLIAYIFFRLTNYAYNIEWWNKHSEEYKKILSYYFSVHFNSNVGDCEDEVLKVISNDHNKYVNWKIIEIQSNF